jgi:hypothetical protein
MSYMDNQLRWFRQAPRIATETLCSELVDEREQFGLIVDLSDAGLRLQRPPRGRSDSRIVQLEFELPEADEIIWAKGEICFDQLWREPAHGVMRTTGVRLVAAASRHLRMLRDYVMAYYDTSAEEMRQSLAAASHWSG